MNIMCKTQSPSAPGGRLAKDAFTIDLHAATVTCPAGQRAPLTVIADGQSARFGKPAWAAAPRAMHDRARRAHDPCRPLRGQLTRPRARQADPALVGGHRAWGGSRGPGGDPRNSPC